MSSTLTDSNPPTLCPMPLAQVARKFLELMAYSLPSGVNTLQVITFAYRVQCMRVPFASKEFQLEKNPIQKSGLEIFHSQLSKCQS